MIFTSNFDVEFGHEYGGNLVLFVSTWSTHSKISMFTGESS